MLTYQLIKQLCKEKGVTVTATERELGFSRGSLCKVDTNTPSMEKVKISQVHYSTEKEF